jgi:3-methyl-2-oxobutanoate hydroxymethyltransferase
MSTGPSARETRVTTRELLDMKARGERIVVLTAYDYLFARLVDESGADVVLVGDSLGQVVLGYDSTLAVTMEDMIHHGRAVRRGVQRALLVVDMPFLSFQVSPEETLRNAGRIMKETGAEAVKLEGGDAETARHVHALVRAGVPVMGHIGLTPQSVHALGGYRVQGREEQAAARLTEEAARLQEAGCFAVVLELMPAGLSGLISRSLLIPTIGIGAGPEADGQVLVLPDMLGLNEGFRPRFLRHFGNLAPDVRSAVVEYAQAVRSGEYPGPEHSFA